MPREAWCRSCGRGAAPGRGGFALACLPCRLLGQEPVDVLDQAAEALVVAFERCDRLALDADLPREAVESLAARRLLLEELLAALLLLLGVGGQFGVLVAQL